MFILAFVIIVFVAFGATWLANDGGGTHHVILTAVFATVCALGGYMAYLDVMAGGWLSR